MYETGFLVLEISNVEDALGPVESPVLPDGCIDCICCGVQVDEKTVFRVVMAEGSSPEGLWPKWEDVPANTISTYSAFNPGVLAGWEE